MSLINAITTQVGDAIRPPQAARDQGLQAEAAKNDDLQDAEKSASQPVSADDVRAAAQRLKQVVEANSSHQLNFEVDDTSKELIAVIKDSKTGEVLRQIPPKELLKFEESYRDWMGLIFNQKA